MKMYNQQEVEAPSQTAVEESHTTAEGWLKHHKGNISRCAADLGLSNSTLRKHRDNNTLSNLLIYQGKVYQYKNDVGVISANNGWELVPQDKADRIRKLGADMVTTLKEGHKVTRDPQTGKVQYWRRK